MEEKKDSNQKMFPKFWKAVEAIAKCCDQEKPILAKSEVYNETWLLRLMLARIYDFVGEFKNIEEPKKKALDMIRKAVHKKWISEGGLEPAFTKEGTTWTDAILGDVELGGYDDGDGDKRKVKLNPKSGEEPCVVVIEAKLGSTLSKSVTNSPDYDQAARNIACLAKLLLGVSPEKDVPPEKLEGAFFVFTPGESGRKDADEADELINKARDTIKKQTVNRPVEGRKNDNKTISGRNYVKDITKDNEDKFIKIVEGIINPGTDPGTNAKPKSMGLTWEEILKSMNHDEDGNSGIINDTQKLEIFYEKALKEISKQKK